MALALGVDIGGTTVAAGVVDEQGGIVAGARRGTPSHDPARTEEINADLAWRDEPLRVISAAGELLCEPAERSLQERITARAYRQVPAVRLAEFGPEAGIVGAADLARQR
jgi:predicted NBD/HSP70 family sugar kinase